MAGFLSSHLCQCLVSSLVMHSYKHDHFNENFIQTTSQCFVLLLFPFIFSLYITIV